MLGLDLIGDVRRRYDEVPVSNMQERPRAVLPRHTILVLPVEGDRPAADVLRERVQHLRGCPLLLLVCFCHHRT